LIEDASRARKLMKECLHQAGQGELGRVSFVDYSETFGRQNYQKRLKGHFGSANIYDVT
jgi:hypothetical protein